MRMWVLPATLELSTRCRKIPEARMHMHLEYIIFVDALRGTGVPSVKVHSSLEGSQPYAGMGLLSSVLVRSQEVRYSLRGLCIRKRDDVGTALSYKTAKPIKLEVGFPKIRATTLGIP